MAGSVVDVKVVPFDVGHDIEDSGVAVDEGLGVDEADALLRVTHVVSTDKHYDMLNHPKPWKLTCSTHHRSYSDPGRGRDQVIIPIPVRRRELLVSTRASFSLS